MCVIVCESEDAKLVQVVKEKEKTKNKKRLAITMSPLLCLPLPCRRQPVPLVAN